MTRAQQVMVNAATVALRGAFRSVREDGWPCELFVDYVSERDTYAVSLRIELPSMPVPIESRKRDRET